ncbi:hypothetical protein [Flavobacterium sp.]|uniref:hypothetical protein n=1 Tax=Flavobacterium sp. TaxID=239 RepID=UPI0040336F18
MKKMLLAIVAIVSFGAYAQDQKPAGDPVFSCKDVMTIDNECRVLTLTEDASYKDAIIEISGASEIIFDQATKELIATGPFDFTIDGSVELTSSGEGLKKLKYKVGEAVAYIE